MKQWNLKISLVAMLATFYIATPAIADDIEIYQSSNLGVASVRPNILFILDTSGSMDWTVTADELPATPLSSVDYSNRLGACFDSNRMYTLPAGTTLDDVDCSSSFLQSYFKLSQNQCAEATRAFSDSGFYTDNYSQWQDNKDNWALPSNRSQDSYYIECEQDQGVHGDGGAATYIATSGTLPYTTSSVGATSSWGNIQSSMTTMYSGNYMNYLVTAASGQQVKKIDIMRNVIENVLFGVSGVNIGLMKFNYNTSLGNDGAVVKYPIVDVSATRNDLTNMWNWNANGGTPLSESLYEAYRVFSGSELYFPARKWSESTEGGATITEGGKKLYQSPVDPDASECQRQFIILLSDGWPHDDADNSTDRGVIENLIGHSCDKPGVGTSWSGGSWNYYISNTASNGRCLDDIAGYMNNVGFNAYLGGGKTATDVKVTTYGIGFNASVDVMKDMAKEGGGSYHEAYNSTQLIQTILDIIAEIKAVHTTFTSPAISVNAFNRTTHRSELYYTLFKPSIKPHWDGNLKRFKLDVDIKGAPSIVDVNGNTAIDNISGFFRPSATSFWTDPADAPDGNDTRKGGAASKLNTSRNVYSNISASSILSDAGNSVSEGNANLTKALLGITSATDAYRDTLVQWARGIDVNDDDNDNDKTDARRIMGDPLHSQPILVQYGGTDVNPDITAYVATNDGYLHAINTAANAGTERFAFIPDDLLPNLNVLFNNSGSFKQYGLDGTITAWVRDLNQDGAISGSDKVYLYFGMRRGGRNYYALDVTNRDNPKFLWKIEGGTNTAPLGNYSELGQTWSTPIVRKIRLGGADKYVLIFAGGYDTNQDAVNVRTADAQGRAIYIADAETGEMLWKADRNVTGFSNMDYSMPSDVSAVDVNGDDYIDHIYVGDMGGQIWRVDIDNDLGRTASSLGSIVTGGRIADLADTDAASNRRFYYAPDVALLKDKTGSSYLSVLITSGYRAHPTNTSIQDRVFMLKDRPVYGKPTTYVTATENNTTHDLFDTTDNIIGQGTAPQVEQASDDLFDAKGWFIDLDASVGEKGLAKPLIFAGQAFFTTYIPADPSAATVNSCTPDEGKGYLYHIYISDGTPVLNYEQIVSPDPDHLTREDRRVQLAKSGIPPDPKYLRPEKSGTADAEDPGDCVVVGTKVFCLGNLDLKERLYWYEQ